MPVRPSTERFSMFTRSSSPTVGHSCWRAGPLRCAGFFYGQIKWQGPCPKESQLDEFSWGWPGEIIAGWGLYLGKNMRRVSWEKRRNPSGHSGMKTGSSTVTHSGSVPTPSASLRLPLAENGNSAVWEFHGNFSRSLGNRPAPMLKIKRGHEIGDPWEKSSFYWNHAQDYI